MIFDLESAADKISTDYYDVCICGSGPAGITIARELAATGKRVAIMEAGGLEYSERSQAVYSGTESGISTANTALSTNRLRYFGGTSNHWAGMCGIFEEYDFLRARHHELPGWPIALSEVNRYLVEASNILDVNPDAFVTREVEDSGRSKFIRPGVAVSPPTRFGTKYRHELSQSKHIDVFLNANLVDVDLANGVTGLPVVERFVVSNYRKQRFPVRAKRFILAMGAVENARLLLNANKYNKAGVGNGSDIVGRCFMEHLNVEMGRFVTNRPDLFKFGDHNVIPKGDLIRHHKMGSGILSLDISAKPEEAGRLGPLRGVLRSAVCRNDTVRDFTRRFKDFTCHGDGLITSMFEQTPNLDSRITLNGDRDEFGLRRAHLHWTISDADYRSIRSSGFAFAKDMVDLDIARVQLNKFIVDSSKKIEVWNHAHHMGTTRMSSDPKYGVVDSNCRVHEVGNLYVAGSSVFPTGGGINPTLTIVMLSVRLGKHLAAMT